MRIDLHVHSSASDGTDAPAEVIRRAARAGLDVVALTDHDTQAGLAEAQAALPAGLTLVPGMELSCELDCAPSGRRSPQTPPKRSVHLLAYLFDPADQALGAETALIRDDRTYRAKAMVARLAELGAGVTWEQVTAIAGDAVVGRPHVARALVASGAIATTEEAFTDDWIGDGGRAFVSRYAPGLAHAVGLVRAAGGVPVLAHPRSPGYEIPYEAIEGLAEAGLGGIEVFHFDHDAAERARLTRLATSLNLIMTGGSDDHGSYAPGGALPGDGGHGLGSETTPQEEYERLLALARLPPRETTPYPLTPLPPGSGRPGLIAKAAVVSGPFVRIKGCGMRARAHARRTTVAEGSIWRRCGSWKLGSNEYGRRR